MKNPRIITKIASHLFELPQYQITNDGIVDVEPITLVFAKGSTSDENIPRQTGFFTESILECLIQHLQGVNTGELANRDTSIAITHLEDALLRLGKRAEDRKLRQVQGTYNK
jgi:hypothetical protein